MILPLACRQFLVTRARLLGSHFGTNAAERPRAGCVGGRAFDPPRRQDAAERRADGARRVFLGPSLCVADVVGGLRGARRHTLPTHV